MRLQDLELKIIPTASALLHEQTDPKRVERLQNEILRTRELRNPPIAGKFHTESGEEKYVILDGATRTTSFRNINCRDLLVQVVDYPGPNISLSTWGHILPNVNDRDLLGSIGAIEGISCEKGELAYAGSLLEAKKILGYLVLPDSSTIILHGGTTLTEQVRQLSRIVEIYSGAGEIYRIVQEDLRRVIYEETEFTAIMFFPRFSPAEIAQIAMSEVKLPAGITRHIIPGRALHINVGLDLLQNDTPLAEKNRWLDEMLRQRIMKKEVRFYDEPVFLFDE